MRRSVKAEVSSSTSATSDPNRWAAAFSVIQASSNADGTYLSARRPISGDTVTCSSDADNTILSKRLPIDGDSLGSSSVSGRIVINQVEIYDLLVSGSGDLYGFLDRIRELPTDNISGSASVYGSVLPDIGLTDGLSFGTTEIDSSLSAYYAFWSESSGESRVEGSITVNSVNIEDGIAQSSSDVSADLSVRVLIDGLVSGSTSLDINAPDILRTIRFSSDPVICLSSVSGYLNKEGAGWSNLNPKSIVSAYPNVRWALWATLTTAPISSSRLDNIRLSVRWGTSVSITDPKTNVVAWAATKFKADTEILGSTVCFAEKMTLNPVWFTGLQVYGATSVDVDLGANRRAVVNVSGSTSLDNYLNKEGACWSNPNPKSDLSVYLNKYGACWSSVQPKSIVSATLSVKGSIESVIKGSSSLDITAIRKRNVEALSQGNSDLTGHITINLKAITDGISQGQSSVTGDLRSFIAFGGESSGSTDLTAEAYRKRNVYSRPKGASLVSATLNAEFALSAFIQSNTGGFFHLSRRFYLPDITIVGKSNLIVYLSAIRPIYGSSEGSTSIGAVAYRKRNAVPDLIYGYSLVEGRLTINPKDVSGESTGLSSVYGELLRYRTVEGSAQGASSLYGELNVKRGVSSYLNQSTDCTGSLNAYYACWTGISGVTQGFFHLSRRFYLPDVILSTNTEIDAWLGKKITAYADIILGKSLIWADLGFEREVSSSIGDSLSLVFGRITLKPVEIDGVSDHLLSVVSGDLNSEIRIGSDVSGSTTVYADSKAKRGLFVNLRCPTDVTSHLNAEFNCPGRYLGSSSVSAFLNALFSLSADILAKSSVTAGLGVKRIVTSDISGNTKVTGDLIRKRYLYGETSGSSTISGRVVLNPVVIDGDSFGSSDVIAYLSANRPLSDSVIAGSSDLTVTLNKIGDLRSTVNGTLVTSAALNVRRDAVGSVIAGSLVFGHLSLNPKEMSSLIFGSTSVSAELYDEDRMESVIAGRSDLYGDLTFLIILHGNVRGRTVVDVRLNRYASCASLISGSTELSANLTKRVLFGGSCRDGKSVVKGYLSVRRRISGSVHCESAVRGILSKDLSVGVVVKGRSAVSGSLSIKAAIYDGDEGGIFSQAGGTPLLALTSEDFQETLPDWLSVYRGRYSLLSALIESINLSLPDRATFELTPLSMDPKHYLSVWSCSLDRKPVSVSHPTYGFSILEAGSWYELMHSPLPKWFWSDGRLYVSRLAMSMEEVRVRANDFQIARPVRTNSRYPVYLLWTLARGDIAYLVPTGRMRWSQGRLSEIAPKFGYLLNARDDLQLGVSYRLFSVGAKANVWLTFQSSSGGDSVPECAPVRVNLTRRGFVSVIVHSDTVKLTSVRDEQIVHRSEGSLSSCSGRRGELVGVFVGTGSPSSVTPSNIPYAPAIGQVFVIRSGDRYIVPEGATRLMLGILHDGAYRFGFGSKTVTVHQYEPDGALSLVYTDPNNLVPQQSVLVDGRTVSLQAQSVDSRFTLWMRLLGHPLSFRGWNGYDYLNYLRCVGCRVPVIPGIPVRWYTWDGRSVLNIVDVPSTSTVEVVGVPSSVLWSGDLAGSRLPYYPEGRLFVDGRWGISPKAGSHVQMRLRFWSYSQSGRNITITPGPNMSMLSGNYPVAVVPYRIVSLPLRVTVGGEPNVFMFSDEVS